MSVSAAERKKDAHMGPGDSFPVGPAGEHLRAAWDLAGHAANPDEVRRHIIAFAHEHGLMYHLPQSAKDWHAGSQAADAIKKAKSGDVQDLFDMAWHHESMENDEPEKRRLIRFAEEHDLLHLLPDDAHGMMHDMGVQHNHEGMKNDENGMHVHAIRKAFNPVSEYGLIEKSWTTEDGVVHFEGWMSTPARDLEKDSTEPEAFIKSMPEYFARRAPLSLNHGTKPLPIGHLQKAAIVRDGVVKAQAVHPTDPAEFEHFPEQGTGVWVRGAVTEPHGQEPLMKGNLGGMSFIGNGSLVEPLTGGRYRIREINPWIETTLAAYPVNPQAVIAVAKAFGLKEEQDDMGKLEELMAQALAAKKAHETETPAENVITREELGTLFTEFEEKMVAAAEQAVQKALPQRPEGAGRKGGAASSDPASLRESDPAKYLFLKARSGEEFDDTDMLIAKALTWEGLGRGLKDGDTADEIDWSE